MNNPCPCCGYYTLDIYHNSYAICPVCYWENDILQHNSPNESNGANHISLMKAKENYNAYGAIKKIYLPYVRLPLAFEKTNG